MLCAAAAHSQPIPIHVASGPLVPLILQMPGGGWLRVNANRFQDVWTPIDLRPLKVGDPAPPERIILAWSGFGWDSNRGDIILYGGGHANYSGNDVYRWRSTTLSWERASLPSEIYNDPVSGYQAIDGVDNAPSSAHTYDNNMFLPIADRFLTWGGAAYNNGGPYYRVSETDPTKVRQVGPYLFDPSKADGNKVGGSTGSHVQRVAPHPEIVGGQMWENRDILLHLPGQPVPLAHDSGCADYATEGGVDVAYVMGGGSDLGLYRYQLTSIQSPTLDQITRMGIYAVGRSGETACAFDPIKRLFVRTGDNVTPFTFWDLTTAGPTNADQAVVVNASIAAFQSWLATSNILVRNCGMKFDPGANSYKIWCGDGVVWDLTSPTGNNGASGWSMVKRDSTTTSIPPGETTGTGILGKWRYASDYDVFVGLEGIQDGNVWIYKPTGWTVPNPPGNALPTVNLTSPMPGATYSPGQPVILNAAAADSDGTISRVEFYANGTKIGQAVSAPFSITWSTPYVGNYSLAAVAVDNVGGMALSPVVSVSVSAPVFSVVLQRGLNGYAANFDTYLSRAAPGTAQGTATSLYLNVTDYMPLLRFAIFASEGGPVPDGATIQSATLQLYKQYYNVSVGLFPLLVGWNESQATWNQRQTGVPWTVPGAAGAGTDYSATSDVVVAGGFSPGWMSFDVSGRVQQWGAAVATNFGWRIAQTDTAGNDKIFYSSEYLTDQTLRPKLTVVYALSGNQLPTVSLTGPAEGSSVVLGGSFNLTATAADSDGTVTKVEFYANGIKVGQSLSAPYALTWTPAATGAYALTAVATDNAGGATTSSAVNVSVTGTNMLPTVSLTGPAEGSSVVLGGSFNLTATAADSDGTVAKVEFYANGIKVGQSLSAPYALTWTPAATGAYALTAVATDNAGGATTSSVVNVSVTSGGGNTTVTLQRGLSGYTADFDATLNRYFVNSPQGTAATLYLNKADYVPLLRFAIFASEGGPVPDGATIQSATLQLYKQYYNVSVGLFPLLVGWNESQATWNQRQTGVPWTVPGAAGAGTDYSATSDVVVAGGFSPGWMSFDVSGRVQQWGAAVATNFGWRIAQTDTAGDDKIFYSSEYLTDQTLRPKLTVVYALSGNQLPTVSLTGPAEGSSVVLGGAST